MHRSALPCLTLVCTLAVACASPAVGAPCLPDQVPDEGFDDSEAYVESGSAECETRTCLVYRLQGDPREGCVESSDDARRCADPRKVEEHVYCSCRCDAGDTDLPECECPGGFVCTEVFGQAPGGYCVKTSTASP